MSPNLIGQVLLNQFRVDAFVAFGGMGAVYRVWDMKRNVPLAIKVLHSELAEDPVVFKRFKREANALKKLAHPNIVPFYGLYETPGFAFLVEDYIDGPSLKDILHALQGKSIPINDVLTYLKTLCAALGYAHANGVVHCDVKPGNVMLNRVGNIYLTDFGIARHSESTTTTMGIAGTPAYMAPEQIRGNPVSPATDVYALGVMLFEILTGQRPFRGTEVGTEKGGSTANERIRYGHLMLTPPDPRTLNPDVPFGLSQVVMKALKKQPEERYATAQELFRAACVAVGAIPETVADRINVTNLLTQREIPSGPATVPGFAPAPASLPAQMPRRLPAWSGWAFAVASLAVILLVVFGSGAFSKKRNTPSVPSGATISTVTESNPNPPGNGATAPPAQPSEPPTPTPTEEVTATTGPAAGSRLDTQADELVMMYVPAGKFTMGDTLQRNMEECQKFYDGCTQGWYGNASPPHEVYLDAFWIDQTEVTVGRYLECVHAGNCSSASGSSVNYDLPVTNVNWFNAQKYCNWVGERLPSEAEWEKAARGTDARFYPWGNSQPTCSLAALNGCGGISPAGSHPNGASPYGALDMAGSVWEWVNDWFDAGYYLNSAADNPQGPISQQQYRSMRGGWYKNPEYFMIVSMRAWNNPNLRTESLGFRCAMNADQ